MGNSLKWFESRLKWFESSLTLLTTSNEAKLHQTTSNNFQTNKKRPSGRFFVCSTSALPQAGS